MDFRKKLLVMSASAAAFAGAASAATTAVPCKLPKNVTGLPNILRLEGTNDLVTDLDITCANSGTTTTSNSVLASGTVVAQLTGAVTSKAEGKASEATLRLLGVVATTTSSSSSVVFTHFSSIASYPGTVNGSTISFGKVTFPTDSKFQMVVSNVRVNSSALSQGVYVTETLAVYNKGVVAFSSSNDIKASTGPTQVGYVTQGFATPTVTALARSVSTLYGKYRGRRLRRYSTAPRLPINLAALFGGAFKTKVPWLNTVTQTAIFCGGATSTCTETNGEQGSYQGGGTIGTANSGTRFLLSFAGIPSGVTVYLPVTVTSGALTLTLTSSATGPFSAVAPLP